MGRYTEDERAQAVALLRAAGYPDERGALARVSEQVGIPGRTISRWFHAEQNPPPAVKVAQKTSDLRDIIRDEIYAIFPALINKRGDASYKELVTAAAILIDKLQLLSDRPSERVEIVDQDERRRRIIALLDRGRDRRDRPAVDD